MASVAINCIADSSRETERKNSMSFKSYVQKSKNVSRTKKSICTEHFLSVLAQMAERKRQDCCLNRLNVKR